MDSSLRHISHLPEHQLSDSEITIEHLQSERASAMQITECFSSFNPQNHPLQSAKGSLFPSPLFAWERTNNPTIQHGTPQRPLIRFRYLESGFGVIFQSALPSSAVPMLMLGQIWKPPKSRILPSSPIPESGTWLVLLVKCFVPVQSSVSQYVYFKYKIFLNA